MLPRLLNYLFGLALIVILILEGYADDHLRFFQATLLSILLILPAFLLKKLTLEGAKAAGVMGTMTVVLGGWASGILLIALFISSSLISLKGHNYSSSSKEGSRRDAKQVWSNGFWYVVPLVFFYLFEEHIFWIAAAGALAASTADTWATELGSQRFQSRTISIVGFQPVEAGKDGGISLPGSLASLAGSLLIALLGAYMFSLHFSDFFIILTAGITGCFIDSYIGWQYQHRVISYSITGTSHLTISNNVVNWISAGFGALITIVLTLIV